MSETTLQVQNRETPGKNASRRLRKQDLIPAVVYGGDRDSLAIQVPNRMLQKLLREGGENAVFLLQLEGTEQKRHAMIRDIQFHPVTGNLQHIDFLRIDMSEKVRVMIPVETVGVPAGVTSQGGILDHVTREVEVECLPGKIPSQLEIDVSKLMIGDVLDASVLELPDDVELVEDITRVLAAVNAPRAEEEPEEEEEEGLLEAEAEEPEVQAKGKAEEEGESEED